MEAYYHVSTETTVDVIFSPGSGMAGSLQGKSNSGPWGSLTWLLLINTRLPRSKIEGSGVGLMGCGDVRKQELARCEVVWQRVSD